MGEYLIKHETLADMADALREILGTQQNYSADRMAEAIREISSLQDSVPQGVAQEAARVMQSLGEKKGKNCVTFIAMSDMHAYGPGELTDAGISDLYRSSIQNAGMGAAIIAQEMQPDFLVNLGNLAGSNSETSLRQGLDALVQVRQDLAKAEEIVPYFRVPGNRDTLSFSIGKNGEYLQPNLLAALVGDYDFQDLEDKKVRLIFLNTADNRGHTLTGNTNTERISPEQLQWFAETIDLSGKDAPEEWRILLYAHHPLDWGPIRPAADCLAAYLDGASYEVEHEGTVIQYDFTGKNAARIVAQFHGHTHCFKVDAIRDHRSGEAVPTCVKRIAIPNVSFHRTNELGTLERYGLVYGETQTYEKDSAKPEKSTSFCLVAVDLEAETVYADCFGAGYDREIPWRDA